MSERFVDKMVLVTGSAGGLGRAFALGFAKEGAKLVLADVNVEGLEETAALLRKTGTDSTVHRVDLAVEADIHAFAAKITQLDVLINNAGLAYGEISGSFEKLSQEKWLRFFAVNTIAPLILAEALRTPLAAGPGVIINQSSMASYQPAVAYGVTKAAFNAMSYGMAHAFGRDGIRVNAIAPGLMETPANLEGLTPETFARIRDTQVLKIKGTPDHIVDLGLFLASDESRFITGEIVHCDGGSTLRGFRV